MSAITTHILDTAIGKPAAGVTVSLARLKDDDTLAELGQATTDADGRAAALMPASEPLVAGIYRLVFETDAYFKATQRDAFYPFIEIHFHVADPAQHYHVPLLLSPFGHQTYRGS